MHACMPYRTSAQLRLSSEPGQVQQHDAHGHYTGASSSIALNLQLSLSVVFPARVHLKQGEELPDADVELDTNMVPLRLVDLLEKGYPPPSLPLKNLLALWLISHFKTHTSAQAPTQTTPHPPLYRSILPPFFELA